MASDYDDILRENETLIEEVRAGSERIAALEAEVERLREAGDAMQATLLSYRFPAGAGPERDAVAKMVIDNWSAALAASGGEDS